MGTKLPRLTAGDVIRALERGGSKRAFLSGKERSWPERTFLQSEASVEFQDLPPFLTLTPIKSIQPKWQKTEGVQVISPGSGVFYRAISEFRCIGGPPVREEGFVGEGRVINS